jgi:hypothetical protein
MTIALTRGAIVEAMAVSGPGKSIPGDMQQRLFGFRLIFCL